MNDRPFKFFLSQFYKIGYLLVPLQVFKYSVQLQTLQMI